MGRIVKKIENIMTNDTESPCGSLGSFLFMLSVVYGGCVKLRQNFYSRGVLQSKRLPCIVISVGNLTLGGTGKTPMTLHLAQHLQRLGYKVVVLSRGYKGCAEKSGGIVSDGRTILMESEIAGDEPYMMAIRLDKIPVVVGHKRYEIGKLAVREFDPDVLVLDDAFQHLRLRRDIDLVLLDFRRPFGNMHLLPRGILREPISALLRGDAFILTRSDAASDSETATSLSHLKRYSPGKPIFRTSHVPSVQTVIENSTNTLARKSKRSSMLNREGLQGRRVFAFSGLANNRDFHRTLAGMNAVVTGALEFSDHHPYTEIDIENIFRTAQRAQADCLVTTEKDYVRISHRISWPMDLAVIGLKSSFGDDEEAFNRFIQNRIEALKKTKGGQSSRKH